MKSVFTDLFIVFAGVANAQITNVADVEVGSKDHTTVVTAVKAADLINKLKSKGLFTVFALGNTAFNKLPKGTVETKIKIRK